MNTCHVLQHAAKSLGNAVTQVHMDSGIGNLNKNVNKLLELGTLERVIAQVDVSLSNAMIEGVSVLDDLTEKRREARRKRVEQNRRVSCSTCPRRSEETGRNIVA